MQHDKLIALRQTVISVSVGIGALITATAARAEAPKTIAAKVEGTAAATSAVHVKPGKLPASGKTAAGSVVNKGDENAIPGTAPLPVPKPRKDALEAGALKAKTKASQ